MNKLKFLNFLFVVVFCCGSFLSPAIPLTASPANVASTASAVSGENYRYLEFANGWRNYSYNYGGLRVCREGTIVSLSGLIIAGDGEKSWTQPITVLPEGFRPAKRLVFSVNAHEEQTRIEVFADGRVMCDTNGSFKTARKHGWVSLTGIAYSVVDGTPMSLPAGAAHYGGEYGNVTIYKEGNIVFVTGAIRWPGLKTGYETFVGQLPEGYRPKGRLIFNCLSDDKVCRIDVLADGKIGVIAPSRTVSEWVNLTGLVFSVSDGEQINLQAGTANYGTGYSPVTYQKIGNNLCLLQGLIRGPVGSWANPHVFANVAKTHVSPEYKVFILSGNRHDGSARFDIDGNGSLRIVAGSNLASHDWLSLSGIVYPTAELKDPYPSGGSTYTHNGAFAGVTLKSAENWKFGVPGSGWVKFKARAPRDIYIAVGNLYKPGIKSWDAGHEVGGWYYLGIGHGNNTWSEIRKKTVDGWVYADPDTKKSWALSMLNVTKGGNPNGVITGGLPNGKGEQWEDYWFAVDNGVVSWGKGTEVGKNEIQRYVDPAPLTYVQYVYLGGWLDKVEFKDIQISREKVGAVTINLPEGFETEDVKFKRVTVGSHANNLEAWALGFDDQLYRFDSYSMAANPWMKKEFKDAAGAVMKFVDVSCASDGTLVALNEKGKAIIYNWATNNWESINPGSGREGLDFEVISVGNRGSIWALDEHDIYQWLPDGWALRAEGVGSGVAVGLDGTVVGINTAGTPFFYEGGKWITIPGGIKLERVAVADKLHIMGSTIKDNALYELKDGKFVAMLGKDGKPATGLDELAINAVGTIFGLDEDGAIYNKGIAAVTVAKPTTTEIQQLIATTVAAGKPAPTVQAAEAQLTKATEAPKEVGKETREEAKKTGKVAKKALKTKTSGKAEKKVAKGKKKVAKAVAEEKEAEKEAAASGDVAEAAPIDAAAVKAEDVTSPEAAKASATKVKKGAKGKKTTAKKAGAKAAAKGSAVKKAEETTATTTTASAPAIKKTTRTAAPRVASSKTTSLHKTAVKKPAARTPARKTTAAGA